MFKLSQVVRSNKQKYMQQTIKIREKCPLNRVKTPGVIVMLIFCYTKPERNQ